MPPTDAAAARGGSTRENPIWLFAIAGLLLLARIGTGVWTEINPGELQDQVEWVAPSAATEVALQSGRPILYAFTDANVPESRKLASALFSRAEPAQQLDQRFVPVRVDGDPANDSPEIAALRSKFGVTRIPTMVVVTGDGEKFQKVEGFSKASTTLNELFRAQTEVTGVRAGRRAGGVHWEFQRTIGGNGSPPAPAPDSSEGDPGPR